MALEQTIDVKVPDTRRVFFEVPREIPIGTQVEFKIIPFPKKQEKPEPPLKCLIGVDTSRADRLLGAAANLGDVNLDEIRDEWLTEKYLK